MMRRSTNLCGRRLLAQGAAAGSAMMMAPRSVPTTSFTVPTPATMQVRWANSTGSVAGMEGYKSADYNNAADETLEVIHDALDDVAEGGGGGDKIEEVSLSAGVLEIDTTEGKFVLNKQAPKHQVWLSSPISGPWHFDMVKDEAGVVSWLCDRPEQRHLDLYSVLKDEFAQITGTTVAFANVKS